MGTELIVKQGKLGVGETELLSTFTVKAKPSFTITGTVAKTATSADLAGTGTLFLTEIGLGDQIQVPGGGDDEFRIVIAVASDNALTVDGPFENSASGQVASCHPSIVRFETAAGEPALLVDNRGNVAITTNSSALFENQATLRVHQLDEGALLLSATNEGMNEGGMMLVVKNTDDLVELDFCPIVEPGEPHSLFSVGQLNGVQVGTGLRPGVARIDANTTLDQNQWVVHVDAGSGGVTLTLPPVLPGEHDGRTYYIYKTAGAGSVSVTPDGSENINGSNSSKTISTQWAGLLLFASEEDAGWIATTLTAA